jgi:hypothetical protein
MGVRTASPLRTGSPSQSLNLEAEAGDYWLLATRSTTPSPSLVRRGVSPATQWVRTPPYQGGAGGGLRFDNF